MLFVYRGIKGLFVCVELVHCTEISLTDTDDDDRKWKLRAIDDLIDSLLKVRNDAICDNEQDVVLLVLLRTIHLLSHFVDYFEDWSKVGWAIQIDSVDGMLVGLDYTFNTINFWVENVTIEGKAVISLVCIRRDGCTKSKHWNLLIAVIILENISNRLDGV